MKLIHCFGITLSGASGVLFPWFGDADIVRKRFVPVEDGDTQAVGDLRLRRREIGGFSGVNLEIVESAMGSVVCADEFPDAIAHREIRIIRRAGPVGRAAEEERGFATGFGLAEQRFGECFTIQPGHRLDAGNLIERGVEING